MQKSTHSLYRRIVQSPLPELAVVVVAVVTRFWRLDYHSFWFDEAVSLSWAGADPPYTWDVTLQLVQDKHPPIYYILLHWWEKALDPFGLIYSEVGLRALGCLFGVLAVVGILLLARRLSGRATGLLAGLLVALSPVQVWYSQELRMFQPATAGIVWSALFLALAWLEHRWYARWAWWAAMVGALLFAVYSYLFSAFELAGAGVVLAGLAVGWLIQRQRSAAAAPAGWSSSPLLRLAEGAVALLAAGLLFLPLARNAWAANASEGAPGAAFMNFLPTLRHLLEVYTYWRVDWPELLGQVALAFFGVLALIGLLLPRSLRREAQAAGNSAAKAEPARIPAAASWLDQLWLWAFIGAPLLIGNLLLAKNATVFAEDRYFLFLGPFVLWAVACGAVLLGRFWRWAPWVAGAAAVLLLLAVLPRLWTPAMLREDWRSASNYVIGYQDASPTLPGAVVAHIDYTGLAAEWYLRQHVDEKQLPLYFPFGGALAPDQVDTVIAPPLRGIKKAGAATLWLMQSHLAGIDDQHLVEQWLNSSYPLVTEQFPTGVKLTGYALRSKFDKLPDLGPAAVYPKAELAPGLRLAACEVTTPQVSALDERMHPPSGWVHVRLWWEAAGPIDQDYLATARIENAQGVWGDRMDRSNDALHRWPTGAWERGIVRDEGDINLNPLIPAGEYPVTIGLRGPDGREPAQKATCGTVKITR